MNPEETLDHLERVLADERAAIRRLDGEAAARIALEKESLVGALRAVSLVARPDLAGRCRDLAGELRRNVVLLAHARDCLEDVLGAARKPGPGARLSVRG